MKKSSKRVLFERMHTIGGMPLNEINDDIVNNITLYHGTTQKHVSSIKSGGLINKEQSPTWYMLSTDVNSAIFHSMPNEGENSYVIEFNIPITNEKWEGYPYLWKPYERTDKSSWYAPKDVIPSNFITNVHEIPYETYNKISQDKNF